LGDRIELQCSSRTEVAKPERRETRTLVDVAGVSLLSALGALLLVASSGGGLLASLLLLSSRSLASWGLAGGWGLGRGWLWRHF